MRKSGIRPQPVLTASRIPPLQSLKPCARRSQWVQILVDDRNRLSRHERDRATQALMQCAEQRKRSNGNTRVRRSALLEPRFEVDQ